VWDEACKRLKALLHPDVYAKWIGAIKADSLDETTLTLSVDNDYYQTWLEESYLPFIKQSVQLAYGTELGIRFSVKPNMDPVPGPGGGPPPPATRSKTAFRDPFPAGYARLHGQVLLQGPAARP
jgi:chromosomal replication initiation ATPase DnaA